MKRLTFTFFSIFVISLCCEAEEKSPFQGRQGKVVDSTSWPGDVAKVVGVTYDHLQEASDSVIVKGRFHKGKIKVSKPLSKKQIKFLMSSVTGKHTPWRSAMCYMPHHGFVFFDKNDIIIGHMSVCLSCKNYQVSPKGELSLRWDWVAMSKLITELKMPILDKPDGYTRLYKKLSEQGAASDR